MRLIRGQAQCEASGHKQLFERPDPDTDSTVEKRFCSPSPLVVLFARIVCIVLSAVPVTITMLRSSLQDSTRYSACQVRTAAALGRSASHVRLDILFSSRVCSRCWVRHERSVEYGDK